MRIMRYLITMFLLAGCSGINQEKSWQEITWEWVSATEKSTGETVYVDIPGAYTVVFKSDQTIFGQADCNTFIGTYEITDNGDIETKIFPDQLSTCGGETMDLKFINLMGYADRVWFQDDEVFIVETKSGTVILEFGQVDQQLLKIYSTGLRARIWIYYEIYYAMRSLS